MAGGKQRNEVESYIRYVGFDQVTAYDGSGRVLYVGIAYPGKATSDASWSIFKQAYDGSGRPTTKRYAGGNDGFTDIWDNRTSLNYTDI